MKKNSILFKIFLVLFSFSSLFAIEESKIKEVMTKKINEVAEVILDEKTTKPEKAQIIFSIMDETFDYRVMSQISLGRDWKKLDDSQRQEFVNVFEQKLKDSYVDKLDLYTGQEIIVKGVEKVNAKRIKLLTTLIGKTQEFEIEYKFYKNKSENWLIYDVSITGVSIMQTYRQQFSSFLENNSFEELIFSLSKKI